MGAAVTEAEDFWEIAGRAASQDTAAALERDARAYERANELLADLPPEGTWQS